MPRILVIGGGISGLATAHYLLRDCPPEFEVLLVEGTDRIGGTLRSEIERDFVFETGAFGLVGDHPHTLDLVSELGLEDRLRPGAKTGRTRYIYRRGRLHPIPTSPLALLRSPLLSLRGRIHVLLERFRPRGDSSREDSVATFGRRRLGEEATRTLLEPLVSGVHAGDVERLSMRSAFPEIAEMEARYGSLQAGLAQRRAESAATGDGGEIRPADLVTASRLFSFRRGMGELVGALQERLGERVRVGWRATAIERRPKGFSVHNQNGEIERAEAVVLAIPSYGAASLLAPSDPETARAFESIPYAPIALACLGFPREAIRHPLGGFGFLVPRDQGLRILGCIWISSIFPDHSPEGHVNLRCLVGGARDPDILNNSDGHLLDIVLGELRPILGVDGDPDPVKIFRYGRGVPQYNVGHSSRIERLERRLWDYPGLFIAGNAYHGVWINDCVREGARKARAVREYLRN